MDEQQKQRVVRQISSALADCAEELGVAAIRELAAINDALRAAGYPVGEAGVRVAILDARAARQSVDNLRRQTRTQADEVCRLQQELDIQKGAVKLLRRELGIDR